MNLRIVSAIAFGVALTAAGFAQDAPSTPPAAQPPAQGAGPAQGLGQGQRGGGRGGWGVGGGGMMGRGLTGTVTAVAADHYTVKTETGDTYTVHIGANTRILKQAAEMRERGPGGPGTGQAGGQGGERGGRGEGMGMGAGANAQTIKPTDIKVGDAIAAMGEVDSAAKSVGAITILQIDPERAKQMREAQANYGKTWLMGKVTAIDGVKVTLLGAIDSVPHTFAADENTTFRKRRDPITLADIQVGDNIRVEGAVKDGTFLATTVNAMGTPPGGTPTVPRNAPPPAPSVPPPPAQK